MMNGICSWLYEQLQARNLVYEDLSG